MIGKGWGEGILWRGKAQIAKASLGGSTSSFSNLEHRDMLGRGDGREKEEEVR